MLASLALISAVVMGCSILPLFIIIQGYKGIIFGIEDEANQIADDNSSHRPATTGNRDAEKVEMVRVGDY